MVKFLLKDIQDPDYNHYRRRIRIVKRLTAQTQEIRRTFQNVLQGQVMNLIMLKV